MWGRLRKRLLSAGPALLYLAWFFGAVAIAMGPLGVEPQRGNLWVVMLIFLAPVGVMIAVEELVHRIRNGPQAPGRHSRGSSGPQSDS
jgi:hypothetical protein